MPVVYSTRSGHALVLGGSMAGLLAARVLVQHFERVTIIDRDCFPPGPELRKGVPQARHLHILLARGRQILERLFPGLEAELIAAGAARFDAVEDFAWFGQAGWGSRFVSGLEVLSCSRGLLDWTIRRRLAAHSRICWREEADVVGLVATANCSHVVGVEIRSRAHQAGPLETLAADLVVDATGRASQAPDWLRRLGYAAPQETVVNAFTGYATRVYAQPADFAHGWHALLIQSKPPASLRAGVLVPLEGHRWIVSAIGIAHDYPPTDEAGFLDFLRNLRTPILYEAIKDAQPLTPISGYRLTENRWRHYERLSRAPEGFLVLGDAACAFNPIYAQGMTTAALAAVTLHRCLRVQHQNYASGTLARLGAHFQRRLAQVNAPIWLLATGEDFRSPIVEGGHRSFATMLAHRYIDQLILRATKQPAVRIEMGEVLHLLKPATALFTPRMLLRLLRPPYTPGIIDVRALPAATRGNQKPGLQGAE